MIKLLSPNGYGYLVPCGPCPVGLSRLQLDQTAIGFTPADKYRYYTLLRAVIILTELPVGVTLYRDKLRLHLSIAKRPIS